MNVVHIQRSTPTRRSKASLTRYLHEQDTLNNRIRQFSADLGKVESVITSVFGNSSMPVLLQLGDMCRAAADGDISPDRLAKRHRMGMLCFFAQNWELVFHEVLTDLIKHLPNGADLLPSAPTRDDPVPISALLNR
jgi:hypothetical protein